MNSGLTIALTGRYFGWGGGIDLLRVIANALAVKAETEPIRLCLLLPVENRVAGLRDAAELGRRIVRDLSSFRLGSYRERHLYDPSVLDFFDNVDGRIEIVFHNDSRSALNRTLMEIGADVALPVLDSLDRSFPVPWLGYIYDFQHRYYPAFFTPDDCRHRDALFGGILKSARAVLVNSEAVKNDIALFHGKSPAAVFALPFAPSPVTSWLQEPGEELEEKYRLPGRYFIISNQFWVHKSHGTAFEALARMVEQGRDLHIVCTGATADQRAPGHFAGLKETVAALGVADRVHFLGHIPKMDQVQIMKKSIGVIQPTLFEGGRGGGSVYDAVALGVPAIVSDIPINREIDDETVRFFKTGSAAELAARMAGLAENPPPRPLAQTLVARGRARAERLGDALLDSIRYVMES